MYYYNFDILIQNRSGPSTQLHTVLAEYEAEAREQADAFAKAYKALGYDTWDPIITKTNDPKADRDQMKLYVWRDVPCEGGTATYIIQAQYMKMALIRLNKAEGMTAEIFRDIVERWSGNLEVYFLGLHTLTVAHITLDSER